MKRYEITSKERERIKGLFPTERAGKRGRPAKSNRNMFNGMLWIARSGAQWREPPSCYGPWQTVYSRFEKRRDNGVLEKVFRTLSSDADMENISIDSTCVKVHQSANGGGKTADKAVGHTRGGLNTKIHTVVDGLGNPLYFQLSAGNVNDSEIAVNVLFHVDISQSNVLADKAYGTNEILDYIQRQDSEYTIPPKANTVNPWRCDWVLYKERHLIECFFQQIKWSEESPHDTINWMFPFWRLSILLLS